MGNHYYGVSVSPQQRAADTRAYNKRVKEAQRVKDEKRMLLAEKIAMMVSNKIEAELIRPGPVAEERECYDMAKELREMSPDLAQLITNILKVEGVLP